MTSLVTSMVTDGVTSIMSTILGKREDPRVSFAGQGNSFQYEFLTNNALVAKTFAHIHAVPVECAVSAATAAFGV